MTFDRTSKHSSYSIKLNLASEKALHMYSLRVNDKKLSRTKTKNNLTRTINRSYAHSLMSDKTLLASAPGIAIQVRWTRSEHGVIAGRFASLALGVDLVVTALWYWKECGMRTRVDKWASGILLRIFIAWGRRLVKYRSTIRCPKYKDLRYAKVNPVLKL